MEVPGDDRDPAIPRPLPCGCGRKGGQRAEEGDTAAKMELGPSSGWERDEETRNLGTEGVGVRGAKAASECKSGPLPALWADLGLSLDFAQRRSGPLTIRSLNKKTMDPGCRGLRGPGHGCRALPRPQPKKSCLQVAPTPCNSNSMWKCPLIPVGLLLSGVGAHPCGGGEEAAPSRPAGTSVAVPPAQDGQGWWAVSRLWRPSAQGSDL